MLAKFALWLGIEILFLLARSCRPFETEYLLGVGSGVNLTCPNSFKDLGAEWYRDYGNRTSVPVVKGETLALGPLQLADSGNYSCFEYVLVNNSRTGRPEERFNHYRSEVLVMDHRCETMESSGSVRCSLVHSSKEKALEVQVFSLCEPHHNSSRAVDLIGWSEGSKLMREFVVHEDRFNCIYVARYKKAALGIWPREVCSERQPNRGCHHSVGVASTVNISEVDLVLLTSTGISLMLLSAMLVLILKMFRRLVLRSDFGSTSGLLGDGRYGLVPVCTANYRGSITERPAQVYITAN